MTAERYVATRDIQSAVKGREEEILSGLGIRWDGRRDHIDCPYPTHNGKDDWRWIKKTSKAICTCHNGRYVNIFGVISRCEGLADDQAGFDEAKIRAAEMIGRADLVKNKGGQKQDVEALLAPPEHQRDDTLPRAYLAHRLGIPATDVIMPSTKTAGWRALGYFDPPAGKGKPVLVGEYPCAIFAMTGPGGRQRHATRIFLAPGGEGKADLGTSDSGHRRKTKKMAAVPEGTPSINGLSAYWGDPAKANHVFVTEGVETGAAVAYAYGDQIAAGEISVAAAISANGIKAFEPCAANRHITVAADRDERATPSSPSPSLAGEKAAREFGFRHHKSIKVDIALPGQSGSKTDWLDILVTDGVEAVRAGLDKAIPFIPTQAEIEEHQASIDREAELQKVAAEYPLPDLSSARLEYKHLGSAVWLHKWVTIGKGDEKQDVLLPVCTPFSIVGRLRFLDTRESYGLRIALRDMRGRQRDLDLDRGDLAKVSAAEARAALFASGLRVENDGEKIAVDCLKAAGPDHEIVVLRRSGWHHVDELRDPFYVCPNGDIMGAGKSLAMELAAGARMSATTASSGTLDGWKAAIHAACTTDGCEHWVIGTIAAFAGVIISLTGIDSCGMNLSGITSSGKTTAQRLAVSAWSRPSTAKDSLFQSARATANSLEATAARANGAILVLDELGHIPGREVGKLIYMIASSVGKGRMTAGATLRESYSWSTFAFLSSETSLDEKIRSDGETLKGGQAVRFPDIDVTGVNGKVDAARLSRIGDIKNHYGHAGPYFVQALIDHGDHLRVAELQQSIDSMARRLAARDAPNQEPDAAMVRAAVPFSLLFLVGSMAQDYDLLPPNVDVVGAVNWAWAKFKGSSEASSLDPHEHAVGSLRRWIYERWNTSIQNLESSDRPTRDALGWYDDEAVYIPDSRLAEAAGGSLKEIQVAKTLHEAGHLTKRKSDAHLYTAYVPRLGRVKAYALDRKSFGRQSNERFVSHSAGEVL